MDEAQDQSNFKKDTTEIADLKQQVTALNLMVMQLAEMNTLGNVLSNGIGVISARLEPLQELRDLTPKRTPLEEQAAILLDQLREVLRRPNWNSTGSL